MSFWELRMRSQARRRMLIATLASALFVGLVAAAQHLRQVYDETGRRIILPQKIERIVSLAPSVTELVYALGLEARLVGVTDYCDHPPAARSKPSVGQVISPSLEKIAALKPDLILATTSGNRRETVTAIERLGIPLYGLNARSVENVLLSIRTLADLLGVPQAGADLQTRLQDRLQAVSMRLQGRARPRVLFVIWWEPLMSAGRQTFVHDVLALAGADSVSASRSEDWPRLSREEVLREDPDYLILARSPVVERRIENLRTDPVWGRLRALRENKTVVLDEAVLRPGPRIADAVEQLARALHPEAFETR